MGRAAGRARAPGGAPPRTRLAPDVTLLPPPPLAAAALGAAFLTASAGVASAATISDPVVVKPGAKIAIDFAGYAVVNDVHYPGKRSVTLKVWAHTKGHDSTQFTVYALAKRA